MNKLFRNIIVFAVIVAFFNSCHKYPEGGWSNVAIKHLFGSNKDGATKTWKLKLYEVNGIDSTSYLLPGNGLTNFQNNEIKFSIITARANDYFASSVIFSYGLGFSKDKKMIKFMGGLSTGNIDQCNSGICERGIFNPNIIDSFVDWKIIKLKSDEFIITTSLTNSYKIILTN